MCIRDRFGFDVANDRTFRHGGHRHDVTDNQLRLLTGIDELTGVRAFRRDKQFLLVREASRVAKSNLRQRSPTSRVVNDVRHDALNVTVSLGKIRGTVLRRAFTRVRVGTENRPFTLTVF